MIAVRPPQSALSCPDSSNFHTPQFFPGFGRMSTDSVLTHVQTVGPSFPLPNAGPLGPSPVASSFDGTEGTDFDESGEHEVEPSKPSSPISYVTQSTGTAQPELMIQTANTNFNDSRIKSEEDEPPRSVIHVPASFGEFNPIISSVPPPSSEARGSENRLSDGVLSPPSLKTTVIPARDRSERSTPRAQTRQEFEEFDRRMLSSDLEDIPESIDAEAVVQVNGTSDRFHFTIGPVSEGEAEVNVLGAALAECWTLCNTLASLSYTSRERHLMFDSNNIQENAWKSCWRLCQKLYDSQDEDYAAHVNPTLDLCRDFCQALFEVRVHDNELSDSVLRVSFELNNHLFNTHDRNLPDAFRERTLDFYITLCHRLMKQRTRLSETDALLSACWSLAEMLFSIRQSKREGGLPDEELLGAAVQACWELCDIFREGWAQRNLRNSDRGTPRPSQATFTQAFQQVVQSESETDLSDTGLGQQKNPETPTTIFEDTASPDESPTPNILVLGQCPRQASHTKWSSSSSNISGQSRSSEKTSSTNTVTTLPEDPNLTSLKALITKAAINSGFQRDGPQNLSSFVKSLSSDAFGALPWQMALLKNYKRLVAFDPAFRVIGPQCRANAVDVARAVQVMVQNRQYYWLGDLYRLVFGFHSGEATDRKGIIIQI